MNKGLWSLAMEISGDVDKHFGGVVGWKPPYSEFRK